MRPVTEALPVTLYGEHLADLRRGATGIELAWAMSPDRVRGRVELSACLRTGEPPVKGAADNFFGGLLPEGPFLAKLANEVGVSGHDVFGLLEAVGSDVAGALRVGALHREARPELLDASLLPELLEKASGYAVGGGGSSLPGFQRKIALTRRGEGWLLGRGALPSTHILKPSTELNSRIADAEAYLLSLSRRLGLTTFDSWTERLGDLHVVVVERYDRRVRNDGVIERIHQEDAAQALNLAWLSDAKFQREPSGASLRSIAGLLDTDRRVFDRSPSEKSVLLRYVTFNLATGNTDAHAKNYSILRPQGESARLAPLYDLVPLALFSESRQGLSLWINGKRMSHDVQIDDLVDEAASWGMDADESRYVVTDVLETLVDATGDVDCPASLLKTLPGYVRALSRSLLDGGRAHVAGSVPVYFRGQVGTPSGESEAG
ncbi:HipA domain-containing protein [Microbacterium sp. CFBP 13617]|uniref:HipA domain-containing protein n=1 Tax=Microbacterium sp. CFBP 13617 TaxID=2774035 RepID=UPI002016DD20|nr:HipA domain-containing protein [Microbacterium sp. CFBP 13617]